MALLLGNGVEGMVSGGSGQVYHVLASQVLAAEEGSNVLSPHPHHRQYNFFLTLYFY